MTTNATTPAMLQNLCCTNDVNGNPRRIWAVYGPSGVIVDALDEGYAGKGEKYRNRPDLVELPSIVITPGEYREWLDRVEHFGGRWEVVETDAFVWHRFHTRDRAMKYRRKHHAADRLFVVEVGSREWANAHHNDPDDTIRAEALDILHTNA